MTAVRVFNILHWAATNAAIESVFHKLAPEGWNYLSAREMTRIQQEDALRAADALIVVNLDLTAAEIELLDRCRIVVHQGVGTDNVDVEALSRRGIPLDVTPVGTTDEVAEYAVLLMLAASRHLKAISCEVDRGAWPTWNYRAVSRSMAGRRVGLVGFGRIGQAVAERILAMKARVFVFPGPGRSIPENWSGRLTPVDSIDALCDCVELLSLHVPLREDTVGLVGACQLDRLPHGAMLVNTGRGPLVDEVALAERLSDGRIAAAALDVLTDEPPEKNHSLLGRPNVVVTPHLSSGTRDSLEAKAHSIFARIERAIAAEMAS